MAQDPIGELRSGVEDMERGIRSHPQETSAVYFDHRDEVRTRAAKILKQGMAEGSLSEMREENTDLACDFVTAASFIIAWYGANKKRDQQKKATMAYSGTLSLITRSPIEASAVFLLQAERAWMSVLPHSRGGCSAALLVLVISGLVVARLWTAF